MLKIYGEDLDALSEQAAKVGSIVKTVKGTSDLYVEKVTGLPQIMVKFDRDRMAKFGLNIAEINMVIRTAFAGESAGLVFEGERRFALVVRLDKGSRKGLDDVKNLL